MEARLNYVLLGIFLVGTLFALVIFIFWMGKHDRSLKDYNAFYLYNTELPRGIREETPVRYLGLPVGFVKSYSLSADKNGVELEIWVKKEIAIKKGAYVSVESQGLTGGNFLSLHQGDGAFYGENEKVVLNFKANWIEKVGSKAEVVFDRLEMSLDKINLLLSTQNINNFSKTLENLKLASARFDNALMGLDSTLKEAKSVFSGIKKTNRLIDSTIINGDYNLRQMVSPLLLELERNSIILNRILSDTESEIDTFKSAPSSYIFSTQEQILGPRE
ncbi:MAG: MlaD family protein [Helicobacteraceae bacterium]|nr:MlaD family protein [Helicobacteraceae bacterium]